MLQGFDIHQLYLDAQSRWLKPSEVLFILQNHEKFPITPQPPDKPPSGSLFLFNRRVLRFFRKDGHVWRRKKDGRTLGEAHERLKVGNIDALSCYYAHGEENFYFQRRSYWMLDLAYDHIVLVHYREVVEGRYNMPKLPSPSPMSSLTFNRSTSPGNTQNLQTFDLPSHSPGSVVVNSESIVGTNSDLNTNDGSETSIRPLHPDVSQALKMLESELNLDDNHCHLSDEENLPLYPTMVKLQSHIHYGGGSHAKDVSGNMPSVSGCTQRSYHSDRDDRMRGHTYSSILLQSTGDNLEKQFQQSGSACKVLPFWKEMLEESSANLTSVGPQEEALNPFFPDVHHSSPGRLEAPEQEFLTKDTRLYGNDIQLASSEDRLFSSYGQSEKVISERINYGGCDEASKNNTHQEPESNLQFQLSAAKRFLLGSDTSILSPISAKQHQEVEEAMPYYNEKNFCDGDSVVLSNENTAEWMDSMQLAGKNTACFSNNLETLFDQRDYVTSLGADSSLTVAQKQLFSIREVSPEWAFSSENTKVIIVGDFLCNYLEIEWKVMFGDIEVPGEIIQNGVIRCQAPPHVAGRISLCVTSGNRESCSEVREFEYFVRPETAASESDLQSSSETKSTEELSLLTRFVQILLCGYDRASSQKQENDVSLDDPSTKLKTTNYGWAQVIESLLASDNKLGTMDVLLQELLKDKLKQWISSKSQEIVVAVSSLSKKEQSIVHMISGLGFVWALSPILDAGVGVNFRDPNGWTALHWAAHFGREKMVAALLAAGASPGAVTDPTSQDPVGKSPASIAAASGHKGLAGYLSEVALTSHLSSLTLEEIEISKGSAELEAERAVESISERNIWVHASITENELSLKESLAAVRNAAQAAARIQAAFRAHSFRKKQREGARICDEQNMTLQEIHELSAASKLLHGQRDQKFHTAALHIQRKYRGWKGRKNFLTLRQRVVKIQAHVRGHQARKKYKEFLWMVSVLEKAILRWRRGGAGLRGFKVEPESLDEVDDNNDDILKNFRKQKVDEALDEAVARVLSMAESPGARQQYRRILESYRLAKLDSLKDSSSTSSSQVVEVDQKTECREDETLGVGADEIVKELRKVKRQNNITHGLLSVLITITAIWQLSEVSLLLSLKDKFSHPFKAAGSIISGFLKGGGNLQDTGRLTSTSKNHLIEANPILPIGVPELSRVDLPSLTLSGGDE